MTSKFVGALDNKLSAALLPLFPVVIGSIVKFSVVDTPTDDPTTFFYQNYIAGAWVEILTVSMVGVIAWGYSGQLKKPELVQELVIIMSAPLIVALICIALRLGLPKFNIESDYLTVALPLFLSYASLAFSSIMIREFSK